MSFSNVPAVRPPESLLAVVRSGCRDARIASNIELDEQAMDNFLLNVLPAAPDETELKAWLASGFRLPLAYPSLHAELNLISNLCMLNSLSGYRLAFHRALGQGAHKTIVQIIISLYLDDPAGDSTRPLSAATLAALTPMVLLDRLGLPTHEEKPHPTIPATVMGVRRRDDIYEALSTLCVAANDTGKRLQEMNCPDLGVFVERTIRESAQQGRTDEERAALIANTLISALPAFNDAFSFDSDATDSSAQPIVAHVHKRAFLLVSWLHAAFLTRNDPTMSEKLPLPNPSVLPAFVDNVIPSLIVHFRILDLKNAKGEGLRRWSQEVNARTEGQGGEQDKPAPGAKDGKADNPVEEGPTLTREEAYRVRAASVDACHALVQRARTLSETHNRPWLANLTEALVDGWLWTKAKRPDLTIVPRMVEKKTFMY